jgi:predicted RNA polymerase sigma factor
MWLHAARLPARVDANGDLIRLEEQDRSLWDAALIVKGNEFLDRSAWGTELTQYHLEAAIASVHCSAVRADETDWVRLVWLYDELLRVQPSPVVALNRAIAVAQVDGAERGIEELKAIAQHDRLAPYPYYRAALAELEMRAGRMASAREHFEAAAALARNSRERKFLRSRAAATLQ